MCTILTSAAAIVLLCAGAAQAAELGVKAPELAIAEWVKGEPVTLAQAAEKEKVVVVEFWATWCPPCRASIPHLTELQKKFKDSVIFIGVSAEDAATVRPFVEDKGEEMDYRVVVDQDRKTSKGYMDAYGVEGIPHAFIVDQEGNLVFHAHPMDESFEKALAAVVAGEFDAEAASATQARQQRMQEAVEAYGALVMEGGDEDAAKEAGAALYDLMKDDAESLSWLAYVLAESEDLAIRDLDFAMKLAMRAVELSESKNADYLDTYATILFHTGQKDKAIEVERQALGLVEDEGLKSHIEEQLERFQNPPAEEAAE
jgi:thiol-disulfide isomerase/thioredoxin